MARIKNRVWILMDNDIMLGVFTKGLRAYKAASDYVTPKYPRKIPENFTMPTCQVYTIEVDKLHPGKYKD